MNMATEEEFLLRLNDVLPNMIKDYYSDFRKGEKDYLDFYGIEKNKNNYLVFWLGVVSSVMEAEYYNILGKIPSKNVCLKFATIIKKYIPLIMQEYDNIMRVSDRSLGQL